MASSVMVSIEETGDVAMLTIRFDNGRVAHFHLDDVTNFFINEWESLEIQVVKVVYCPGDVVLEAGAGSGHVTMQILKTGANCIPMEPQPDVFRVLCQNLMSNGYPKLTVARMALMDGAGNVMLNIPNVSYGASVVDPQRESDARHIEVPCIGVNEMLNKVGCNCLHLDVEGAEVQILNGLDFSLINKLTMEVHPGIIGEDTYTDIIEPMLTNAGFEMVAHAGVWRNFPTHNYVVGWERV